jgi:hypothetical protein
MRFAQTHRSLFRSRGLFFIFLMFLLVSGCQSKERIYQGVYEGLNAREQIVRPSTEPNPQPITQPKPDYNTYKRERETTLKDPVAP